MRRGTKFAAVALTGAMAMTACGDSGNSTSTSNKTVKVGLAYDIGGRGDKSFNDAAAAGLEKAKKNLKVQTKELSAAPNETDADKEERLRLLAKGGYNPIVAIGFAYAPALKKVAKEFPDTKFGIIDDASVSAPNVTGLVFAENEGSYLVGAAAALKSKTGNVGYIGGCLVPLLQKFEAGYVAGAKAAKPGIKVQVKYLSNPPGCSGFNDPAAGTETANGMYDAGADVIFAAAGGSGSGVFDAAVAKKKLAIGTDSDQYKSATPAQKKVILTSMLKRVDVAVDEFVEGVANGKPLKGTQVFDLKRDGVGYSRSGGQVDDIASKLEAYKKKIVDGSVKVPVKP